MTIDVKNLSFGYEGTEKLIFDNVSLRIDTDWKLGLYGRNGRGKTTFLKLLKGELQGSGTITGCPDFISFPFEIYDEYSLGEDVIHEIAPQAPDWIIRREMNLLELDEEVLYKPYYLLSGGEKTKLQLISLFLDELNYPLIDEPTNHLDTRGRELVSDYLRHKNGFILISHDRTFLNNSTDHTMAINKSDIEISSVPFNQWWEEMKLREKHEEAQNDKLRKEISRLKDSKRSAEQWSNISENKKIGFDPTKTEKSINRRPYEGAKSAKMMRHAKALENRYDKKISEKSSLLKNQERKETLKISGDRHHSSLLVKASSLVLSYDDEPICEPINLEIRQGDKLILTGINGCGKTSLLRLIEGNEPLNLTYEGELYKASGLTISVVGQDTSGLKGTLREYASETGADLTQMITILRKLGLSQNNLDQDISTYSEGQKKCVYIAGSLCHKVNLFIWDEPMNYIDIYIREAIEELLSEADITLLFVEHDVTFKNKVATNEVEIKKGAVL